MEDRVDEDQLEKFLGMMPEDPRRVAEAFLNATARVETSHPFAAQIIIGHSAIESEMWKLLRALFPNPGKLPNKLAADHIIGLLRASTLNEGAQMMLNQVQAFGDVRNSVAHSDPPAKIQAKVDKLFAVTRKCAGNTIPHPYSSLAVAVFAALGGFGEVCMVDGEMAWAPKVASAAT